MTRNLTLDNTLVEEARRVGRHKTQAAAVRAALEEYIQLRKQCRIVDLFGAIDFDPAYDYKAERKRARR